MAQQVETRVAITRSGLERIERGRVPQTRLMPFGDFGGEGLVSTECIEQFPLCAAFDETLELMLAVDLRQRFADGSQNLQRYLLAVEIGPRLTLAREDTANDEFVVGLDALLLEQREQRLGCRVDLEGRGDLGAIGAVPDGLGTAASAHRELQRIDQDGLSGAGFAGEYGEPSREVDFDGIDDGEVSDVQVRQHTCRGVSAPYRNCAGPN